MLICRPTSSERAEGNTGWHKYIKEYFHYHYLSCTFNLYHQAVSMTCGTRLHAIDYSDGINEKCPSSDGLNEPPYV